MSKYLSDEKINVILSDFSANEEIINELLARHKELVRQKLKMFNNYISKLEPIFEVLKDKRYYFRSPVSKYRSSRGPVLKVDFKENSMFVLDFEASSIKKININNFEESRIVSYYQYVKEHGIDEAFDSLNYNADLQKIIIEEYKEAIKISERSIEKDI